MKCKFTISFLIISFLGIYKIIAQNNENNTAHFRAIAIGAGIGFDTRLDAATFYQELNLMFRNGLIEVNGNYGFQISEPQYTKFKIRLSEFDNAAIDPGFNSINIQYEAGISYNFLRKLNTDATLSRSGGKYSGMHYDIYMPGSRAMLVGTHIGFGSFISEIAVEEQPFNLKDQNGKNYSDDNSSPDNQWFRTFSNYTTNYIFLGMHYKNSVIKDDKKMKIFGWGRNIKYYLDLMVPISFKANNMYFYQDDLILTPIPKEGDSFIKPGFRAGVKSLGGPSVFSMGTGLEFGSFPGLNENNFYFQFNLSLVYKPKKFPMKLELID